MVFLSHFKGHNDGSSVGGWLHNVWNRQRLHQEVNTCRRWEGLSIESELPGYNHISLLFSRSVNMLHCWIFNWGFLTVPAMLNFNHSSPSYNAIKQETPRKPREKSPCLLWMFEAHPAAYMKFQSSKIPKPKGQELNPRWCCSCWSWRCDFEVGKFWWFVLTCSDDKLFLDFGFSS